VFPQIEIGAMNRFRPEVIAGPPDVLQILCWEELRGPRRAFVVLRAPGSVDPSSDLRETLWKRFQVPVYEQWRGFQGELLATECDVQQGLHMRPDRAYWETSPEGELLVTSLMNLRHPVLRVRTGLYGRLDQARCECHATGAKVWVEGAFGGARPKVDRIEAPLRFAAMA
jgi:phenylacetate-coenzyme A ligase PaaK-like adenylate-forming protein